MLTEVWGERSARFHVVPRLRRAHGFDVDATFRVERLDDAVNLVVEVRGGTHGTSIAVNTQYAARLRLLLERLKEAGHSLADAAFATRATAGLMLEERRLDVGEPGPLEIDDPQDLQRRLGKAQERIGKPNEMKGGSATRRIRLWVTGEPDSLSLVRALIGQRDWRASFPGSLLATEDRQLVPYPLLEATGGERAPRLLNRSARRPTKC